MHSIILIGLVALLAAIWLYVKWRQADDLKYDYSAVVGDVPQPGYFDAERPVLVKDSGSIVPVDDYVPQLIVPPNVTIVPSANAGALQRKPNGTFAKGHSPVGVKRGAGGKFVSAKAAA